MQRTIACCVLVVVLAGCTGGGSTDTSRSVTTVPRAGISLGLPRAVHRATTLLDGRVLITGGCSTPGCDGFDAARASVLFDPMSRRFVAGPTMRSPRASGTATLLRDGRVLLTGGYPGEGRPPQDTAELFDPGSDSFISTASMGQPRAEHTATRLQDGRVLLAGGRGADGQVLASTELFDPNTGRFAAGPQLSRPRAGHAAAALEDGVLLVGGTSDGEHGQTSTELLRRDAWFAGPTMASPRVKHAALAVGRHTVFVLGGSLDTEGRARLASTELLDVRTGRSRPGPDLAEPQYKLDGAVAQLPDGRVVIGGGTRVELYDPHTNAIAVADEPATPRRSFVSVSVVGTNLVLVAGGYDDRIIPTRESRLVHVPG